MQLTLRKQFKEAVLGFTAFVGISAIDITMLNSTLHCKFFDMGADVLEHANDMLAKNEVC